MSIFGSHLIVFQVMTLCRVHWQRNADSMQRRSDIKAAAMCATGQLDLPVAVRIGDQHLWRRFSVFGDGILKLAK